MINNLKLCTNQQVFKMAEGVKLPPTNGFSILEVQTYRSTTATSSYLRFSSQTFFKLLGAAASLFCKVDFVSWFSSSSTRGKRRRRSHASLMVRKVCEQHSSSFPVCFFHTSRCVLFGLVSLSLSLSQKLHTSKLAGMAEGTDVDNCGPSQETQTSSTIFFCLRVSQWLHDSCRNLFTE